MDFLELLDFVAYDIEAAHRIVEEEKERVEKIQPKPVRKGCRGLCSKGGCRCSGSDVERSVLIIVL